MKNCRELSNLLHDYVEGQLEPSLSKELDTHLADCPGCVTSIKTYKGTIDLSKDLRCQEIPPELQRKLGSFIKQKMRKPSLWARIRSRLTGSP